jgi:hypothetical protein
MNLSVPVGPHLVFGSDKRVVTAADPLPTTGQVTSSQGPPSHLARLDADEEI